MLPTTNPPDEILPSERDAGKRYSLEGLVFMKGG
jgi:hypothetical protein